MVAPATDIENGTYPSVMTERGRRRGEVSLAVVIGAVLALLLAACMPSSDDHPTDASTAAGPTPSTVEPSSDPPPSLVDLPEVSVAVVQERIDRGARIVSLVVTSPQDAAGDVTVTAAVLDSPAWEATTPTTTDRTVTLRPGSSRSMFVELGTSRCETEPDGVTSPGGVADLVLTVADGEPQQVAVEVTDPSGHLARAWGEDCAGLAVAQGLTLSLGDSITTGERDGIPTGTVDLWLDPVPGGPDVSILAVRGTGLMVPIGELVVGNGWEAAALRDPAAATSVALDFTRVRCDAHAIAEDKRGTYLALETTVDGVARPTFYLQLPLAAQSELMAWYGDTCDW